MPQIAHYRIQIGVPLTVADWGWFEDLRIGTDAGGGTVLFTPAIDQTALHGILATLRDLAIPLVAVQQVAGYVEDKDADITSADS